MSDQPLAVARRETLLPAIDVSALIEKAVDSKAAVEVLKELHALHKSVQADAARDAFFEAMRQFKARSQPITKRGTVKDMGGGRLYSYAPIDDIEAAIAPLCESLGFSHRFDCDTDAKPGFVISICTITHVSGHSESSRVLLPIGAKNKAMDDTKVYAAALTFANRRALQNAYGLVLAGEDTDGSKPLTKPRGPGQPADDPRAALKALREELWNLLTAHIPEAARKVQTWDARNQFLWHNELIDGAVPEEAQKLSKERLQQTIEKVRALP